jgi:hypothetical protein
MYSDQNKLHVWLLVLLSWNAALLCLLLGFLYWQRQPQETVALAAQACSEATRSALQETYAP